VKDRSRPTPAAVTTAVNANHRARVEAFLANPPIAFCAKCIGAALGLNASAVQRAASVLEGVPGFRRVYTRCAGCGKPRLTVQRQ